MLSDSFGTFLIMLKNPLFNGSEPLLYLLFLHLHGFKTPIPYPKSAHPLTVLVVLLFECFDVPLKSVFLGLLGAFDALLLQFLKAFLHLLLLLLEIDFSGLEVVVSVGDCVVEFL